MANAVGEVELFHEKDAKKGEAKKSSKLEKAKEYVKRAKRFLKIRK